MKKRTHLTVLTMLGLSLALSAGPKIKEGSLAPLKGEQLFNVQAVWDTEFMYDGDDFSEFYAKKLKKLAKEPQELESFKADWVRWKDTTYAAFFAQGIENFFEDEEDAKINKITATTHSTTPKYTFLLQTVEINSGGMSTAYIELNISVVETANHKNVIAVIEGLEISGRVPYASEEVRVRDAYFVAGDEFADDVIYETLYEE